MDLLDSILQGFAVAITFKNLLWCFLGVFLGTAVGVLPGIGPTAAMAILLPVTYNLGDPLTSIIFMAGIYYGTQYGGSTTAILLNLPGEVSSTVTAIDGYQMTKKNRGGAALAIAASSSFFAGTVATLLIATLAEPLSIFALAFGPAEYASLMLMGLIMSVSLTKGSLLKGIGISLIGVLIGQIGTDVSSGMVRFSFGTPQLIDGISFSIVAMGIFGLGEIIYNTFHQKKLSLEEISFKKMYPSKVEIRQSIMPTLRGTTVGSVLGLLPGGGSVIGSFASYMLEKFVSKDPRKFGRGAVAGVAGPEAANNAGAQTSFIPMLSLGIPTTPVMALIGATLIINGIQPGPQLISQNSNLFWGLIASMWIGNFFLIILNLPLIGIWTAMLRISWKILYTVIVIICFAGIYFVHSDIFSLILLLIFAIFGYVLRLLDVEPAPLALGFIIGTFFEEYFKRTLLISQGDWSVFVDRPISLSLLLLGMACVIAKLLLPIFQKQKNAVFKKDSRT